MSDSDITVRIKDIQQWRQNQLNNTVAIDDSCEDQFEINGPLRIIIAVAIGMTVVKLASVIVL